MPRKPSAASAQPSKRITWVTENIGYRVLADSRTRSYCIDYDDAAGKRVRQFKDPVTGAPLRRDNDAKTALAKVRVAADEGRAIVKSGVTFAERGRAYVAYLDTLPEGELAERTKALWRGHVERHLIPFFGNLKMNEVKRQHVRAFLLKKRQDGLAEATIRSICSPLRAILDEAVEENLLAVSPWVKVPKKERPKGKPQSVKRILTVDEIDRLLAEAEQRGPGLKAFASTLVFAGLRIGEALGLVWSDIDFDTGEIRIRQQLIQHTTRRGPLKTKASRREVPISTELRKALKTWWLASEFKCDQHFVFSTLSGRPTTHRNALRALQRAATAVGLNVDTQERDEAVARGEDLPPNVDAHCLRHLFASAMIRATKGDAEKVAKLTGHDDVKTLLDVYSHDFTAVRGGRDIQKDIELIDAAFAG